ncbi:MAG: adenylyltransferase/cytidyltransferase family protein [Candidatus Peregrinibacteria bacterium]|nr:adenylyltransferase/cytidyltransferase family protein [Candidatus Peregrinibacteria bacterium]
MSLPALYIGRFQPFHLGHLDAVRQILSHETSVIIAIGSAQYSNTETNPYTFATRKQIIESSLAEEKISPEKYIILPLNDIHDDARWCDYADETLPHYGKVYTGSPVTKSLYEVKNKHPVIALDLRLPISSTAIREKIKSGGEWRKLVPPACYKILKSVDSI